MTRSIADILVRLLADETGFEGDVVRASRKAGDAGAKTLSQRLSEGLRGAGKGILAGLGIGAGISAFNLFSGAVSHVSDALKGMVQSAIDDEASVNRLTAALEANIPGWDGNTAAIERTIKASELLGFTDDETRASLTFLTAATHDLSKAQQLHAVAMDLARFKGISLQAASEALVKVEAGRYRILASLGIVLRAGATQTEALAAVQAVATGQAEAFGETTAGAMLSAEIAIEEAGEAIGRDLLPVVKELAFWTRDSLVPTLTDVLNILKGIGPTIGAVAGDLQALTGGGAPESFEDVARSALLAERALLLAGQAGRETSVALREGGGQVRQAAGEIADHLPEELEESRRESVEIVKLTMKDIAKALVAGQAGWEDAWDTAVEVAETDLTEAAEIAAIQAHFASDEYIAGINNADPEVRASFEAWRDEANDRLLALAGDVPQLARETGSDYAETLATWKTQVGAAGGTWAAALHQKLTIDLSPAGRAAANTFLGGFTSVGYSSAAGWLNGLKQMLVGNSPPPAGPLKDMDTGAMKVGQAWGAALAGGIRLALPALRSSLGGAASAMAIAPGMTGLSSYPAQNLRVPTMPASMSSVGDVVTTRITNYHLNVSGVPIKVHSPEEAIDELRRLSVFGEGGRGTESRGYW